MGGEQKGISLLPQAAAFACKIRIQYKDMPLVQPMQPPGVGNLKKYIHSIFLKASEMQMDPLNHPVELNLIRKFFKDYLADS